MSLIEHFFSRVHQFYRIELSLNMINKIKLIYHRKIKKKCHNQKYAIKNILTIKLAAYDSFSLVL